MATRMKMKAKRSAKNDDKGSEKSLDEYDTAVLSKSVITSINNLSKIIKLYQNTTEEIRQYLTAECDILYECRVCRNIFRSLSNFILHKRKYCREKFSVVTYSKWFSNDDDYMDIIENESCNKTDNQNEQENKLHKKNLSSIIDNLTQKKQIDLEIQNMLSSEHKENQKIELNVKCKTLGLEHIEGSNCGVFQTINSEKLSKKEETTKLEIMEMYRFTEGQTAVLGPDGKVTSQKPISSMKILGSNENANLTCPKCNVIFCTRKTLQSHIKYKHESERLVYPCLECSDTFATVWSVYRHLYSIHHKTLAEVRKMRPRIKAKSMKIDVSSDKNDQTSSSFNDQQKIDEEDQAWMDNFESDNDIQMCGGCGRRFERKAALNSHSQTCQKRITARNLINLNKQKRIAAFEDKPGDKKNQQKIIRLDPEAEKNFKQKISVAKKRKIGIQIRYDYNKTDRNVSSPVVSLNTVEDTDKKLEKLDMQPNKKTSKNSSENEINKSNSSLENDLLESEIVSIPSSNSSPNKDDQDPLAIKEPQSDSDCEIEEILGPIEHSIFGGQSSKLFDVKDGENEDESDQYKTSDINEGTLKLIKLINSDIPPENLRPTLDEKMSSYINLKRLKCIPCDIKFGNISKLRHHMACHFNWNRFRCDICVYKAYDKIEVFEHIKKEHNILEFEKIEAVILQMPDWETTEFSSDVFIPTKEIEITPIINKPADKRERESTSGSESPDNCIIIENNDSDNKQTKKQNLTLKQKKKVIKLHSDIEHVTADSISKDPLAENQSDDARSEGESSSRSNQDPELKKMVYEVIFGQDITVTKATISQNVSGEEKDSVHIVPNDVSNVISRPVRNRVKPLLYKDFIYDLHGFKEHHKTVLVSDNSLKTNPLENKISDSLEEDSIEKTNKIRHEKKTNRNNFGTTNNLDKNLNLQKRAIETFADNQVLNDGSFPQNITILNESNATLSDEDDDIYIIENEELVAIK